MWRFIFGIASNLDICSRAEVRALLPRLRSLQGNSRRGRSGFASDFSVQSPEETRQELLAVHKLTKLANAKQHLHERAKRQGNHQYCLWISNINLIYLQRITFF